MALTPRMSGPEKACYRAHLEGVRTLVEFGCGGSTLFALQAGVGRIWSVESDPAWIAQLAEDAEVKAAIEAGCVSLLHADLGEVGPWGYPKVRERDPSWLEYPRRPWPEVDWPVDLVLVDGRFRAACALVALEHIPATAKLLIHDLLPERRAYHLVLPFLDEVERVGTLGVFHPKAVPDWPAIRACLRRVQWNPG